MSDATNPNERPEEGSPANDGVPVITDAAQAAEMSAESAAGTPNGDAPVEAVGPQMADEGSGRDLADEGSGAVVGSAPAIERLDSPSEAAASAIAPAKATKSAKSRTPKATKSAAPSAGKATKTSTKSAHRAADVAPALSAAANEAADAPRAEGSGEATTSPAGAAASENAPGSSWFDVAVGGPSRSSVSTGAATPTSRAPTTSFWSERPSDIAPPSSAEGVSSAAFEVEVRNNNSTAAHNADETSEVQTLAANLLRLIRENMRRMTDQQIERVNALLRNIDLRDYLDPDFWKGIGMVLRYQVDEQVAFIRRRLSGEYTTDPFGMDREVIEVVRPFLRFMYRTWWRIKAEGVEHVPAEGRALLVANHSGVLPWDGAMIAMAVAEDHPAQNDRVVRSLHLHWFSTLPFVAPFLAAMGQVPGMPENAVRLLENDELVCVFPEGLKGIGKPYKERYKLARFGRGGFVQAALRTRSPIVPVAVVGAEEIYPMLADAKPLAKLLGMPYFPITPFFPWLGPLGAIPLPTRWSITFGEPLPTHLYDPAEADDPLTVLGLTELVRQRIQAMIETKLNERKTLF